MIMSFFFPSLFLFFFSHPLRGEHVEEVSVVGRFLKEESSNQTQPYCFVCARKMVASDSTVNRALRW